MQSAKRQRGDGKPFAAMWFVWAPWAHSAWNAYVLSLADLTTDTGEAPNLYAATASYELIVWAVDPSVDVFVDSPDPEAWLLTGACLQPPNHYYQFNATHDDAAFRRVDELASLIEGQRLSPDTDARRDWDRLFADGASLIQQRAR